MRLTFSTTGKSFTSGNSTAEHEDCFAALSVSKSTLVLGPPTHGKIDQVEIDLNTEQAQALVDQLLRDYPYLKHDHSKRVEA